MNSSNRDEWNMISRLEKASVVMAIFASLFGFIALLGYALDLEYLYRPIKGGPATNPLTAVCLLMGGLYLYLERKEYFLYPLKQLAILTVFSISLFKIVDFVTQENLTELVTPFYTKVHSETGGGMINSMGMNTDVMFLVFSLALFANIFHRYKISQVLSAIALVIPSISLLGYLIEKEDFYVQMSLLTAVTGMILAMAALTAAPGHGYIRSLLEIIKGKK